MSYVFLLVQTNKVRGFSVITVVHKHHISNKHHSFALFHLHYTYLCVTFRNAFCTFLLNTLFHLLRFNFYIHSFFTRVLSFIKIGYAKISAVWILLFQGFFSLPKPLWENDIIIKFLTLVKTLFCVKKASLKIIQPSQNFECSFFYTMYAIYCWRSMSACFRHKRVLTVQLA